MIAQNFSCFHQLLRNFWLRKQFLRFFCENFNKIIRYYLKDFIKASIQKLHTTCNEAGFVGNALTTFCLYFVEGEAVVNLESLGIWCNWSFHSHCFTLWLLISF